MGSNGYAYDSVFLDPDTCLSYGELSYEEKQQDSHRTRAFQSLKRHIARISQ
jgi:inosine/xanthosine triphosphate pyrophosphatase family protein